MGTVRLKRALGLSVLSCLALGLFGCSGQFFAGMSRDSAVHQAEDGAEHPAADTASAAVDYAPEEVVEVEGDESLEPPVSVRIAQAFVADNTLKVKVHVQPKIAVDPAGIVVSLFGLKDGEIAERQAQRLSDVVSWKEILPSQKIALLFSVPSQDLSEYQVRCSWGREAGKSLESIEAKAEAPEVPASPESIATADLTAPAEPSAAEGKTEEKV